MLTSLTDHLGLQLKKLQVGESIKVHNGVIPHSQVHGWYRAARKVGIRISIRTTPGGVTVWRVQ